MCAQIRSSVTENLNVNPKLVMYVFVKKFAHVTLKKNVLLMKLAVFVHQNVHVDGGIAVKGLNRKFCMKNVRVVMLVLVHEKKIVIGFL